MGQVSDNMFYKDLDFVYENLKKSSSYKTQTDKHKLLEAEYGKIKKETSNNEPSLIECYIKLYQLLDVLDDNHNSITGNTKSFSYNNLKDEAFLSSLKADSTYNFYPKVKLELDSLESSLSSKVINDFEGVYHYDKYFKIAIFKNKNNLLQGVVLETKIPSWERGETILYLKAKENNCFRLFIGNFVHKKLISSADYFKDGTFKTFNLRKDIIKNDFYNVPYSDKKYLIKRLNKSFTYLKLGTFDSSNEGLKQTNEFYKQISDSLNTPKLIVDLRNNGGGGDKSSVLFYELLKNYKREIYLLTNYYTGSNAEQFIMKAKSLNNVTVLGDRTFGIVTYGRNYNEDFETPSKRFRIHFSDMKDNWRKYLKYENVGIAPDVYLDSNSDWIEQIIKGYSR